MEIEEIITLARNNGIHLKEEMNFNEMGIDFKVGFATDLDGNDWVLRIPRRDDLTEQIETEKRILKLAKKHLSVAVPNWKIANADFIAYPLLENKPVITFDAVTYDVTWNINKENSDYVHSLAKVLVDLHQVPEEEVKAFGLKITTPEMLREDVLNKVETVKRELGISEALETRWRRWLDNDKLWPNFTRFIHGDLYAGHVLASENGEVSGIIDWSEGQVSDPSIDFSGHIAVFGEESVKELIHKYQEFGGQTWEYLFEQAVERHAAAPLAYGVFAVKTNSPEHLEAAKAQLGV
jgi:macrolide phosphotransferase